MKKLFLFLFSIALSTSISSQNFTWVDGSTTAGAANVYGTMGTPAPGNTPCGRHGCAKWTDAAGNLWLFGGEGPTNSWHNDLWKYNISTNQWTWVAGTTSTNIGSVYGTMGVSSPTVYPGCREFISSWADASGNLWLFGGDGWDVNNNFVRLGDLWKFNIASGQWTWVNGFNTGQQNGIYGTLGVPSSTNMPGNRYGAGMWTDASGNFWLYGGRGLPGGTGFQGYLSDLWKYNPTTNQWAWMAGPSTAGQPGTYGTMFTPAPANFPGGRYLPGFWTDPAGKLYLHGGFGFASAAGTPSVGYLNDFWVFDQTTLEWTWIGGSTSSDVDGAYGTLGVPSTTNVPSSRRSHCCWRDVSGNFWLFGGERQVISVSQPYFAELNDMYRYNPVTKEWTWMKGPGNLQQNQNGNYGTMGVTAPSNIPGGRSNNTWWTDQSNNFWLFGGEGYDINDTITNHMNDVWTFTLPCNPDSIVALPKKNLCENDTVKLNAINGNSSTNWYNVPTGGNILQSGSSYSIIVLGVNSSATYTFYAASPTCTAMPRTAVTVTFNPLPTVLATAQRSIICTGEITHLTAGGANTYSWMPVSATGTTIAISPTTQSTYTVTGTDLNGCVSTGTVVVKVSGCTGINETEVAQNVSLYPNPSEGIFLIRSNKSVKQMDLIIFNAIGQKVFEKKQLSDESRIEADLSRGVYYYKVLVEGKAESSGKLVIE